MRERSSHPEACGLGIRGHAALRRWWFGDRGGECASPRLRGAGEQQEGTNGRSMARRLRHPWRMAETCTDHSPAILAGANQANAIRAIASVSSAARCPVRRNPVAAMIPAFSQRIQSSNDRCRTEPLAQ